MKPTYDELIAALQAIVYDFENEGCEGCGTISATVYNQAGRLLLRDNPADGFVPVDETTDEDREEAMRRELEGPDENDEPNFEYHPGVNGPSGY